MRVPEFKPTQYKTDNYSYCRDDIPYFGSTLGDILQPIDYRIRHGNLKFEDFKTEEGRLKFEEIWEELIFPIGENISDKFRQLKTLCPDSKG